MGSILNLTEENHANAQANASSSSSSADRSENEGQSLGPGPDASCASGASPDKIEGLGFGKWIGKSQPESGILKDEAITLFQRFYCRENENAPEKKRKRKDGREESRVRKMLSNT